jgi:hypothetical protein
MHVMVMNMIIMDARDYVLNENVVMCCLPGESTVVLMSTPMLNEYVVMCCLSGGSTVASTFRM